jgi:hypothetical protein
MSPAHPGYTYICEATPVDATTPPECPTLLWWVWAYPAPLHMRVWRRRVYCDGSPVYVEVEWTPTKGVKPVMKDWTGDGDKAPVERARQAPRFLLMLMEVMPSLEAGTPGRGEKPEGFDSYPEAIMAIIDVVRRLGSQGKKYGQKEVAHYFCTETDRFKRESAKQDENDQSLARRLRNYCRHEGLTWKDIIRRAGI